MKRILALVLMCFGVCGMVAVFCVQQFHTEAFRTVGQRLNELDTRAVEYEGEQRMGAILQSKLAHIVTDSIKDTNTLAELQSQRISILEDRLKLALEKLEHEKGGQMRENLRPGEVLAER